MRPFDGKSMSDERFRVQFAISQQAKKSIHVARFRPAHVADRVVNAFLFVSGIVSSGPV